MIFSSIYFVYLFLPIVLAVYYLIPGKWTAVKNLLLLAASLFFYAYGEPRFIFVLLASVVINYLLALGISRKKSKLLLILAVILNVGILFVFKYLGFTAAVLNEALPVSLPVSSITLPIGISFFTFQALSYVIDVYRGERLQKNLFDLALYICFFPQLIAGPIVRYHDIADQLKNRSCGMEDFGRGVERFLIGFSKKVLLANHLAVVADGVFDRIDMTGPACGQAWMASICYSLQLYYDFSGYSDMAIGLGQMFGFRFLENFDHPYIADSITDFWRRWHKSLSGWFRDYVYIPLGGSRVKTARHIFNLFVVWLLTGIWHGANYTFICWGLLYFVFLLSEKYLIRPDRFKGRGLKAVYRVFTLLVVNGLWVLFRADSIQTAGAVLRAMFFGSAAAGGDWYRMIIREQGFFLVAAILFCMPLREWLLKRGSAKWEKAAFLCYPAALMLLFLWGTSYLILGAHNPFLYFNF